MYVTGKLVIADGCVEFCEATAIGLVDKPKVSLYGRETNQNCVAPVDASRDFIYFLRTSSGGRGGGYAARLFLLFSFPCSVDHERDWPTILLNNIRRGFVFAAFDPT